MDDACSWAASSASAICPAICSASSNGTPSGGARREALALDALHHQPAAAGWRVNDPVDVRDIRMSCTVSPFSTTMVTTPWNGAAT